MNGATADERTNLSIHVHMFKKLYFLWLLMCQISASRHSHEANTYACTSKQLNKFVLTSKTKLGGS